MKYILFIIFILLSNTLNAEVDFHFKHTSSKISDSIPKHQYIAIYPNTLLIKNSFKEYNSFPFKIGNKIHIKSGKYWHIEFISESKTVNDDFLRAVEEVKGNVFYKQRNNAGFSFRVVQPDGVITWVKLHIKHKNILLDIIDEKVMEQVLVFDIDTMKMQLDALGKLTLGGIYFESSKSVLQKESDIALLAALKLMNEHKGLDIKIAGHTDNQGDEIYNSKLSLSRAISVQNWLISKGIENTRLSAVGYGEEYPIVGNDTLQQRQENRRVELIDISKKKDNISLIEIIQAYPSAKLLHEDVKESSSLFNVATEDEVQRVEVVGKQLKRIYEVQTQNGKKDKSVSGLQIKNNYLTAIKRIGGKILHQEENGLTFRFSHASGKKTWGYLWAPNARYTLILVSE